MFHRPMIIFPALALLLSTGSWDTAAAESPAKTEMLEIYARCHANRKKSRTWELTITTEGIGTLVVKRRSSSSLPKETRLMISESQVERIRKGIEKADFFNLNQRYGSFRQRNHPNKYTIRIATGTASKEVLFVAKPSTLHDVPAELLELWCVIRESFDDPEAHNGLPFMRSFLSHGRAAGFWSLQTIDGEPIGKSGLDAYTLVLSADGTWRSVASVTDKWSGPKPLSNGRWTLLLDVVEYSVGEEKSRTPFSLKRRESLTLQADPVLVSSDGTPAKTNYVWHPLN